MKKQQQEQVVKVTQLEILNYAIEYMRHIVQGEEDSAKKVESQNPEFAKQFREQSIFRKKLKVMLQLYKIESGEDFNTGFDFEL